MTSTSSCVLEKWLNVIIINLSDMEVRRNFNMTCAFSTVSYRKDLCLSFIVFLFWIFVFLALDFVSGSDEDGVDVELTLISLSLSSSLDVLLTSTTTSFLGSTRTKLRHWKVRWPPDEMNNQVFPSEYISRKGTHLCQLSWIIPGSPGYRLNLPVSCVGLQIS